MRPLFAGTASPHSGWLFGFIALSLLCLLAGQANAAIYWGNGSPIGRANLDGTNAESEFIKYVPFGSSGEAAVSACGGVAVDGSHVYWADPAGGAIGRANLDGSGPAYGFITGADNPCGVAVNDTHVYWTNLKGNSIGRANLDGTEATQTFIDAVSEPCGVAVDHKFIYWTSAGFHYIGRALLTGDKGPHLVDGDGSFDFCGVAVNGTHLFWGGFGNRIGRVDLDGSNPDPAFIAGIERPCGLAVGGGHIYWVEQTTPSGIASANLDGTVVNRGLLTDLGRYPCGIAVDGLSVVHPLPPSLSWFSLGRARYNGESGVAFVPVYFPDAGYLHVTVTAGISWVLLPDRVKGNVLPSGGQRWLKLWPGKPGGNGRRIRRLLKRNGRTTIGIEIEYGANGHKLTRRGKRILLFKRAQR